MKDKALFDQVMDRVGELVEAADKQVKSKYASKPLGTVERKRSEQKALYQGLTVEDMAALVKQHGLDAVEKYIHDMEVGHGVDVSESPEVW